jgi:iron(III) transport system ATP-binding protein
VPGAASALKQDEYRGVESGAAIRLELRGLRKTLGAATVVNGIDLTIAQGESLVLLGPSGCGKTTTLRMVAGFIPPDSGEIYLSGRLAAGRDVFIPTERRQLGMVFQSYAVWPHKTVFNNVAYGLSVAGTDRATLRRKVDFILDLVQLTGFAERYPGDLSGGQQQRVALARAIVVEPSLLLLDEPLSNLDAGLRQEMRLELKRLHRRTGMTSLYVTHDQEEALILADRVAVMNRGVIEQVDRPETVYRRPRSRFVAAFVGTSNILDGIVTQRDGAGSRLEIRTVLGAPVWAGASAELIGGLAEGDPVAMVLRPEDISLAAPGDGRPTARLVEAAFLGSRHEVELAIGDQRLIAHARSLDMVRDGMVGLEIAAGAAWAVPTAAS